MMHCCLYFRCVVFCLLVSLNVCRSGGSASLHIEGNGVITGSSPGSSISLDIPTASTVVYIGRLILAFASVGDCATLYLRIGLKTMIRIRVCSEVSLALYLHRTISCSINTFVCHSCSQRTTSLYLYKSNKGDFTARGYLGDSVNG